MILPSYLHTPEALRSLPKKRVKKPIDTLKHKLVNFKLNFAPILINGGAIIHPKSFISGAAIRNTRKLSIREI